MKKTLLSIITITAFSLAVNAQNVNIPDANFKTFLLGNTSINTDADPNEISVVEATNFTGVLDCSSLNISDLTGIEAFTNMTYLNCHTNSLTTLDVSNNLALTNLSCTSNSLTTLNLSANTALNYLYCNNNSLTVLNVANGNNTNFTIFYASSNPNLSCIQVDDVAYSTTNWTNIDATSSFSLNCVPVVNIPDANFKAYLVGNSSINTNSDTEIQVSEATAFTGTISCSNLSISDLTGIEAFTALTILYCTDNSLITLVLSNNTVLTNLRCHNNSLTTLDVSNNTALIELGCVNNSLTTLDVSNNTNLIQLSCGNNSLTTLDVSNNVALTTLYCGVNSLTNLDISNNTALTDVGCGYNSLTTLDVSNNTVLTTLSSNDNSLTTLDVSNNTALSVFICFNNFLTTLDVSNNTALTQFRCDNNSLTILDVANGNNTNLIFFMADTNPNLTCIKVDDVAYSTTNWTAIDAGASFSLNCGFVGVNEESTAQSFSIYPNPVNSQLNIKSEEKIETITIMDIMGKTLETIVTPNSTINVSHLTKGIYFLQIQMDNRLVSKKFIKE